MIIIIGLGNPGEKFKNTRHNLGFMVLDRFAGKNNFPEFKLQKKYNALISENIVGKEKIVLAKPQTFMNESGKAAQKIISNSKFQISNLIVVHDDIDLPLGKIKIVKERGSAGHKGVESIIKTVGNNGLARIRIGICPKNGKPKNTESFVIKNFAKEEKEILSMAVDKAVEGLEKAMNEYN